MKNNALRTMIEKVIKWHFGRPPLSMIRLTIGMCNEVYCVTLDNEEVIIRLSNHHRYLAGSRDHIPLFKSLGIPVPDILFEDYSQQTIPLSYQIQSKILGTDLGGVITTLTEAELRGIAKEIVSIFNKVKTLPTTDRHGILWGNDDHDLNDNWTHRMNIRIEEAKARGKKTGILDDDIVNRIDALYLEYTPYFNSIQPTLYYGDIASKNVMIHLGLFSGLVDLDALMQGDPLEAVGRIYLQWHGTPYGTLYTNAIMDEMNLNAQQRQCVIMYALFHQFNAACENGIQLQVDIPVIFDPNKAAKDKSLFYALIDDLSGSTL